MGNMENRAGARRGFGLAAAGALWLGLATAISAPAHGQDETPPNLLNAGEATHSHVGVHNGKPAIYLVFDETLDTAAGNLPPTRLFFIRTNPDDTHFMRPTRVTAHNSTTLRLDPPHPFFAGQSIEVSYIDPTAGNDRAAIQDSAGNDYPDLQYVTIQRTVPAAFVPAVPQIHHLGITEATATTLNIYWDLSPPSPDADSFDLQYAASTGRPADGDWVDGPQGVTDFDSYCRTCRRYILRDLTPGTPYWVRVRGTNSSGAGGWSSALKTRTAPGARPQGPVHRSMRRDAAAGENIGSPLQWRNGLTFSLVNFGSGSKFDIDSSNGQLKTKARNDYRYRRHHVRVYATDNLETYVTFDVYIHWGLGRTAPAPPAPLVAVISDLAGGVAVTWQPSSGGEHPGEVTDYQLGQSYRSGGSWSSIYTDERLRRPVTETSTFVLFLDADTDYRLRVRARYSDGTSGPWSRPSPAFRTGAARPDAPLPVISLALPENGASAIRGVNTNIYVLVSELVNSHEWEWSTDRGISFNYQSGDSSRTGLVAPRLMTLTSSTSAYRLLTVRSATHGPLWIRLEAGEGYRLGSRSSVCIDIRNYGGALSDPCPADANATGLPDPSTLTALTSLTSETQLAEGDGDGLTAEFRETPARHSGSGTVPVKLAFSEALTVSWKNVFAALSVTGGTLTRINRIDGRSDLWNVVVAPGGDGAVTVSLPASKSCTGTKAICAGTQPLSSAASTIVPGPAPADPTAELTVSFESGSVPDTHDGTNPVVFRLAFSEEPASGYSYKTMRDKTLDIRQSGPIDATAVRRLAPPGNRRWEVTVDPVSKADIAVGLGPTAACTDDGAVCTGDGRKLANAIQTVIKGPPGLSVADVTMREAAGANVNFTVSLSRAASAAVTVDYSTSDGSARAASDYTATSGTLTFAAGTTEKTVSVPVLDDTIDEGSETFTLTLSNASGGNAWLADATATGTIANTDPMPQAWLARFGRTIASQAVDAIGARMEGGGSHVVLAGEAVDLSGIVAGRVSGERTIRALDALGWTGPTGGSRTMSVRDLLLGSSFRLSAGDPAGGMALTGWGRFATGRFDGNARGVRMDGKVTSGFLGVDVSGARALAGVALGVTEGDGTHTLAEDGIKGMARSSLAAVYPYGRLKLTRKIEVWGLAGYGQGRLTLKPRDPAWQTPRETANTDLKMQLGALGVRGQVLSPEQWAGLSLVLRSDAFMMRMRSESARSDSGNLEASVARANRVRLVVDTSRPIGFGSGGTLTPTVRLGVRRDGGDAETGTGYEAGGGLRYTVGRVTVEVSARSLIAHSADGYREWGASGRIQVHPDKTGRGVSFTLAPSWGQAQNGVERLWSSLAGTRSLAQDGTPAAGHRLVSELGYGFALPGAPGLVTPYAGVTVDEDGNRAWLVGTRWRISPDTELAFKGTREESGDGRPDIRLVLHGRARW